MSAIERTSWLTLVAFALGLIAVGCDNASEPSDPPLPRAAEPHAPPTSSPTASDSSKSPGPDQAGSVEPRIANTEAGHADYQIYCASCHGPNGGGDGPVAPALSVQPAKHNDGHYMNALNDEYLFKVIAEGGRAVGKSEMMAPWNGSLSDEQIHDIIAFIRSLADPPYSD